VIFLGALMASGCSDDEPAAAGGGEGGDASAADPGATSAPAKNSACQVVVSGEITESTRCNMALFQSPGSKVDPRPYIGGGDDHGRFGFQLFGVEPKVGTFATKQGLTADGTATSVDDDGLQIEWNVLENKPGHADTGSYTLVITGVSPTDPLAGFDKWEVDGTLDASFEPDATNPKQGTVDVHMDF
jgi:hypothetical protein